MPFAPCAAKHFPYRDRIRSCLAGGPGDRLSHSQPDDSSNAVMLPIRLGIVTAIAALCLWGLFSLLDSLKQPGLLRSDKAVVVKGCDALDSDETRQRCPALFCEKALLDSKAVPLRATFDIASDEGDLSQRIITGRATSGTVTAEFQCELNGTRVVSAETVAPTE